MMRMSEVKKRYTNIHIEKTMTIRTKYKKAMTAEEARELGRAEIKKYPYLQYLGIMGVDITLAELNKIIKSNRSA
jgi:hypothetical protein